MAAVPQQRLRVLPEDLTVELLPEGAPVPDRWRAIVRAPEGLTVIREALPGDGERWAALYGENAHGLDLPGMLVALLAPLSNGGVPVFVASTFHSDLVLVPRQRLGEALETLRRAGHTTVADTDQKDERSVCSGRSTSSGASADNLRIPGAASMPSC